MNKIATRTAVILSLSCISTLWMGSCGSAGMEMASNNIQVEFSKIPVSLGSNTNPILVIGSTKQ